MWTDSTLKAINDADGYIGSDGTQYPYNYPKNEIPGLFPVTLTDAPNDPNVVVVTFTVNESHVQVWHTRSKTEEEITLWKESLKAALADYRWQKANGGVVINGHTFRTDTDSKFALTGALIAAQANPGITINWKLDKDEGFIVMNAADIVSAWQQGSVFVQKCFDAESTVLASIDNYNTVAEVKSAFDTQIEA